MFQLDWAQKRLWEKEKRCLQVPKSSLRPEIVQQTLLLHWEEHCLECAIPHCYEQCPLYEERADKKCRNFVYGIYPNRDFRGLFNFGADVRFRKWGKLETKVYGQRLTVFQHYILQGINYFVTNLVNLLSDIIQPISPRRRLNSAWAYYREKAFETTQKINSGSKNLPDGFVLEIFLPEGEKPFRLILEYCLGKEIRLRSAFDIKPGQNFYTLPVEQFNFASYPPTGRIAIYPEDNAGPRVAFTWLDFVTYTPVHRAGMHPTKSRVAGSAEKVKCVAWDLDNTLWEGILMEDGVSGVRPRPEALALINKLDERGIIQTIASKNNFSEAWAMIEKLELQDYFLYPAIHWGPKSESLKEIARRLNINLATFVLIDDSPFERAEVQSALPQVRVYSVEQIPKLLSYSEFDVPITEMSKTRRASYLAEIKRDRVKESFSGDYESFLRTCQMQLRIFIPEEEKHILRCLELIQRSNQLNLSARRYTEEQFRQLLSDKGVLNIALGCKDKFGDYGIVGFASIAEKDGISVLQDLVISCRVAQKRVEHTFLKWLTRREVRNKRSVLRASLTETELNKPLLKVFEDVPFKLVNREDKHILMELSLDKAVEVSDVMSLEVDVSDSVNN